MNHMLRLAPGSIVLNQDTAHPMSGRVLDIRSTSPTNVWVSWTNGTVSIEQLSDLTLTAHIIIADQQLEDQR